MEKLTSDVCLCHVRNNNDPDNADYDYAAARSEAKLIQLSCVTHKPATVNIDVKRTCCLSVTRRRQRSGIGFPISGLHRKGY